MHRNLQPHRAVLPAIAWHLVIRAMPSKVSINVVYVCYDTFIDFYSTFIIANLYCRCVLSFLPINEYDDDDDLHIISAAGTVYLLEICVKNSSVSS